MVTTTAAPISRNRSSHMKASLFFLLTCALVSQAAGQPSLVSSPGAPMQSGSGHSYLPLLSDDRTHVVFLSSAKNLVTNDNLSPYLDVFGYDLSTGEIRLISRGANGDSRLPSVSSNGQWIAFASDANNLVPGDANSGADIFRVDANSGAILLMSATVDGSSPGNPAPTRNSFLSDKPQISADGRCIAFESFATNLTADADANTESDVFLRDTLNDQTTLISSALGGGMTASGKSEVVAITPDGNYILFSSTATNVVLDNPQGGYQELYLRDGTAGITTWVFHTNTYPPNYVPPAPPPGNVGPFNCRWALMSRDANSVLYKVEFSSSTNARVHLYDRQNGTNMVLTTRARAGSAIHMSSDGRFIAYDETNHVFLLDRVTGTRTQISTNTAHSPMVSDDGSIVAFVSGARNMPFQIFCRITGTGELRQLTGATASGQNIKDHSSSSITVDPAGEFILFDSGDNDLVADDRNRATDVFLHRIATGETHLISRAHESLPPFTPSGTATITNLSVSADGRRILFFSGDSNLVPGDTNNWPDAFLYDANASAVRALTTNQQGLFGATNSAVHGLLSPNGRYALLGLVAPASWCEFGNAPVSIIRKDLDLGETLTVLSNVTSGPGLRSIAFFGFSMSADGRFVAYPFGNPFSSSTSIILSDLQTGIQTNLTPSGSWTEPLVSPDGRYVAHVNADNRDLAITDLSTGQRRIISSSYLNGAAFSQDSQTLVYRAAPGAPPSIYVYSLAGRSNAFVCTSCINPSVSATARFVTYEIAISGRRQVEVRDLAIGSTTLVTRNIFGTGGGNADAIWPVISADGRFIAYTSKATTLTTDPANGWNNLHVFDRLQGTTVRVSGNGGNAGYGSGSASKPVLSPDGRTLVFQSFASDFVANDFNDARDIFLLKLGEGDSDNDGMSDSWEQTHFSTTDRDGTSDFDQDGSTDLAEYLAGTNPVNGQSVLEVLKITSVGTNERQLIWSAQPGKSYRLEYKTDLSGTTWTSLGQIIAATATTASGLDTAANSEKRFYRVALVQ